MRGDWGSGSVAGAACLEEATCLKGGGRNVRCPRLLDESEAEQMAKADLASDHDAECSKPTQRNNRSEICAPNARVKGTDIGTMAVPLERLVRLTIPERGRG